MVPYVPAFAEDASTTVETPVTAVEKSQQADDSVDSDRTMTRMSGSDRFRVSMRSNVDPVPLSHIHSWTLHLETPEGDAIDDAQIGVYGDMPAHRHGLPSKPRVTENRGGGDYLIEGVKFTMPGRWQLILIITADGKRDKAKFNIDLP
ncbi:MAG: FixH family protein [Gammaproteobacteria bacterium]|nr:FixH family protein [Gammaproteobacteria bacterium]